MTAAMTRPAIVRRRKRRNWAPVALIAPAVVVGLLVFAAPFVNAVITTFRGSRYGVLTNDFSFRSWIYIFTTDTYIDTTLRTLGFALVTMVLCIIIAFPVAYYIVFRSRISNLLTLLTVTPLLLNAVVLGMGWIIMLNSQGLVNSIYKAISGSQIALELLNTPGAVILGLTFVYMPYMLMTMISTLRGLDTRVIQSAQSLGASPARAFWDVTVPLSLPGVLSGAILVFSLSAGVFVIPLFLGGPRLDTLPMLAYNQALFSYNTPQALATSFMLLVILLVVISVITRLIEGGRFKEVFRRAQV